MKWVYNIYIYNIYIYIIILYVHSIHTTTDRCKLIAKPIYDTILSPSYYMFIYTINLDMIEEPDQGSGSSKDYHPMSPGIVILAVWEDRLVVGHMTYVSCTKLFFLGSWNLLFFFFPESKFR